MKIQDLEDLSQRLTEFHDVIKDIQNGLKRADDKVQAHYNNGSAAKDPIYAEKIKVNL